MTDLKALVNFALGEEARLKAIKAASHRTTLSCIARTQAQAQAPTPRPGGSLPKQGGGTKRPPSIRPEDGFEAVQKKKAFRPKVDPAKWGPPDAHNAKNPRIFNAEAARRMSEGICIVGRREAMLQVAPGATGRSSNRPIAIARHWPAVCKVAATAGNQAQTLRL